MTTSESGYVEVPGGHLYFEVDGAGPAITLIHAGVAHLRMWDAQAEAWRNRYRVVRYDTRGWGKSRTEDVPYANREDLRLLLDHLSIDRTHLIGNSRGGSIALDFCLEHPDRVRSLTLVASGLGGFNVDDPRLVEVWPQMERLEQQRQWEPLVEMETRLWVDGPGQPEDRVNPEMRRRMVEWNLENYRAEQVANQPQRLDPPAAARLSEVRVPVLVVWGKLDELGVVRAGEKMAAEIPGAQPRVFDDVAHMVSLERPEEFNRLIAEFLETGQAM